MTTFYGYQAPEHPYTELLAQAGNPEFEHVMFYPMVPLGSRPCQWPGSIKVLGVMVGGKVMGATRLYDGSVRFEGC